LTERGKTQVKALAQCWANVRIDAMYTSDLERASDTALALKEGNKSQPDLVPCLLLRERDYGSQIRHISEWSRRSEVMGVSDGGWPGRTHHPCGEGESLNEVANRARAMTLIALGKHGIKLPDTPKIVDIIEEKSPSWNSARQWDKDDVPEGISHNVLMCELSEALSHFVLEGDEDPAAHKWSKFQYANAGWSVFLLLNECSCR